MNSRININIACKIIGLDHLQFVIAEISGNHNQSLERALQIVGVAAKISAQGWRNSNNLSMISNSLKNVHLKRKVKTDF
jgi:sialic acid synthase SpsE